MDCHVVLYIRGPQMMKPFFQPFCFCVYYFLRETNDLAAAEVATLFEKHRFRKPVDEMR